ncbi:MAG: hypothetical protein RBR78_03605 [Flavobacteriaceae bacterium]|jgi:hypothetical protein|nr:hypothetical protein [Flavobacteriaceae bacterium]
MKTIFRAISCVFLITISSCTLIPCGWDSDLDSVKEKPTNEFLIGKYQFDERTKHIQGFENSQNAELNIKSDGTFEINNIPKRALDFNASYMDKSIDVNGEWKANYYKEKALLNVKFMFDSTKTDLNDFYTSWRIYKKDQKAVIFIMVGDPDECSAARFEKITE